MSKHTVGIEAALTEVAGIPLPTWLVDHVERMVTLLAEAQEAGHNVAANDGEEALANALDYLEKHHPELMRVEIPREGLKMILLLMLANIGAARVFAFREPA